ncbi:peroxisomal trans-2-enoyl-CoA reductase-like [Littorina saxatilis]|uniref:Peroxisomal trans-2-enoyl-CoA reductase n=1 Tax=Littorina saxatilis TaxID=31220 RepID=A0AAN9G252_9CAEN
MAAVSSVFRQGLFKGRVAVVTGGGTGIGQAIALELMYLGCSVVIASRKVERLQAAAQDMRTRILNSQQGNSKQSASAPTLSVMKCNIREELEVSQMLGRTLEEFGRVDFLVNNAGGQFLSAASSISEKGWKAVIDTNLTGTFLCCREAYNQWMKDNGGSIVNIIADMYKGFPSMSHTGAARAGVDNLTKSLSIEWADTGTRVNALAPGSSIYSETAVANYGNVDIFSQVKNMQPTKRLGTVEEISAAVCFLLSPAAAFISGETLYVDGGGRLYQTMWQIPDHKKSKAYTWKDDVTDSAQPQSGSNPDSKL